MSKLTKSLLGVGLAIALVAGLELTGTTNVAKTLRPATSVEKAIDRTNELVKVAGLMVQGCAMKAETNPQLAMIVMMSKGQVCVQIIEREIKDVLDGKTGYTTGDDKAAFAAGYAKTHLAFGGQAFTKETKEALASEIEDAYQRLMDAQKEE